MTLYCRADCDINTRHHPAAEAISGRGRPQRRSVKNRKSFDCFKSAVRHPIQRRRKDEPEIVSPRRFFGYLLSEQKVTYKTIMEDCDSQSRAGRVTSPRSGVIFGGSRKARPPQPPKISSTRDRQPAVLQNRAVRRRPTAADCWRTPTAVGERHIPTNCAAKRHYLRQSAQSSPPAAAHFSTKKDRPNTSGSLFSKNLNYKLAIL